MIQTVLAVVVAAATPAQATPASSVDPAVVEKWVREEFDRAREPRLTNTRIVVRYEQHAFPSPQAMAEMAARVEGHPDHTERPLYEIYRQRERGVPSAFRRTIWFGEPGVWRFNEDFLSPEFPKDFYSDAAATPRSAFFLQHQVLSILDPRDGVPPGKDPKSLFGTAVRSSQVLVTGGVWLATWFDAEVESVRVAGDDWQCFSVVPPGSPQAGRRWSIKGTWSAADERGIVTELTLVESIIGDSIRTARPSEWRQLPHPGGWVAGKVETYNTDGRLAERYELLEVSPESPSRIAALVSIPARRGDVYVDAARGEVPVKIMHDHRSGESTVRSPSGDVATILLAPESMAATAGSSRWLEWVGWGSAAGLVVVLVVVRLRSRARGV